MKLHHKVAIGIIMALSLVSCVGHQDQENLSTNPLTIKSKSSIAEVYYLSDSNVDDNTKFCFNRHYSDEPIHLMNLYINDNGDFGGRIYSKDPNGKDCALLPYAYKNKQFKRLYVQPTNNYYKCVNNLNCGFLTFGFTNSGDLIGYLQGDDNSLFQKVYTMMDNDLSVKYPNLYGDPTAEIDQTSYNKFNAQAAELSIRNIKTGEVNSFYNLHNYFKDNYIKLIGDIIIGHQYYFNINDSIIHKLPENIDWSISDNKGVWFSNFVWGGNIHKWTLMTYNSTTQVQGVTVAPNDIKIASNSLKMTTNNGVTVIETWDTHESYLYNSLNNKWYLLKDLLKSLRMDDFMPDSFSISPNGNHFAVWNSRSAMRFGIAKVDFPSGMADYLKNNVQPVV
jgi:hypothetical protein